MHSQRTENAGASSQTGAEPLIMRRTMRWNCTFNGSAWTGPAATAASFDGKRPALQRQLPARDAALLSLTNPRTSRPSLNARPASAIWIMISGLNDVKKCADRLRTPVPRRCPSSSCSLNQAEAPRLARAQPLRAVPKSSSSTVQQRRDRRPRRAGADQAADRLRPARQMNAAPLRSCPVPSRLCTAAAARGRGWLDYQRAVAAAAADAST